MANVTCAGNAATEVDGACSSARVFEDQSPPKPELDPVFRLMRRTPVIRERGAGRPSKKERRELDKLRGERS